MCENLKQDHTVQRRSCRRVPGGARLHDYWQQASKRGAAKEVRFPGFPGFRPDGDGERCADHGGERDEAQVVRAEGGGGREFNNRTTQYSVCVYVRRAYRYLWELQYMAQVGRKNQDFDLGGGFHYSTT